MATITREHPLQGLPLPIVRLACRQGRLELLLQTPDGSRRFVPLEWTDADTADPPLTSHCGLASLAGLLRLRTIVDALLRRPPAAKEKHDALDPVDSAAAQPGLLPAAQPPRFGWNLRYRNLHEHAHCDKAAGKLYARNGSAALAIAESLTFLSRTRSGAPVALVQAAGGQQPARDSVVASNRGGLEGPSNCERPRQDWSG